VVHGVPYGADWATLYEEAALVLRARLERQACVFEHIGSTGTPGVAAKPILDLMLRVSSFEHPIALRERAASTRYQYRPADTVAERLYFMRGPEASRTHSLPICLFNSAFWRSTLAFRDRLRTFAGLAHQYTVLKRGLAARFADDRARYVEGKAAFIQSVTEL
jgi:GrpB-like predicted nucleotidyltransferase (UPF0157 family)